MTFEEADRRFGSDKPDTRFGLEIEDATEATRGSEFGVFAGAEAVRFLRVPQAFSRGELAKLEELAKEWGAKGLAYLVYDEEGEVRSPIAKFLSEAELAALRGEPGDDACSSPPTRWPATSRVLGALRLHLGRELGLIDDDDFTFLWVDRLPDVRVGRGRGALDGGRTTRSRGRPTEWEERFARRSRHALAHAYDLIVNGNELGGGSLPDPRARASRRRSSTLLGLTRGGAAREVRLPARRARDGRAAARRDRARDRPDDDGARRRAEPPRRDRVPEEPGGRRPDERRAVRGHAGAAATSSEYSSHEPPS